MSEQQRNVLAALAASGGSMSWSELVAYFDGSLRQSHWPNVSGLKQLGYVTRQNEKTANGFVVVVGITPQGQAALSGGE